MVSSGELGLGHTYETMGDNKIPANQGYSKTSAPERRVIGSHSNPAYGANGAFAD
ncbi:hypothetical protein OS493_035712 [Desmophyllum pertusum]|uniref:Uncharacterized protein n=1 Tax=Desmophyllum pertusum TaxID=174260 RepID=A0A9X0CJU0_9CNID|nr:hypothetical protein OS493_035712 [Desmophyllum pertusum]